MVDVYKNCPEYENEDYLVRMVCQEDRMDLLKVYSDKRAVPFFNSIDSRNLKALFYAASKTPFL